MIRSSIGRWVVLLVALSVGWVSSTGCKSKTAKDADAGDPVQVLDAGAEPREALRYKIAPGTTTTSNMDFGLAALATSRAGAELAVIPGVRLHVMSGPAIEAKKGTRFDVRIVKSEPLIPKGVSPEVARDLKKGAAVLNNVGGWVEIDDRGIILDSQLNEQAQRADVPVRLLVMIINARTSLSRVMLPAEPVGVGARWEARKELILYGFEVDQIDTYTLTERNGDELKLSIAVRQTAAPQSITFDEEGVELTVESYSMEAQGQIVTNLNALEANAKASGESVGLLQVRTVDGVEPVEVDRAFQVQMTVTYDPGATNPAE